MFFQNYNDYNLNPACRNGSAGEARESSYGEVTILPVAARWEYGRHRPQVEDRSQEGDLRGSERYERDHHGLRRIHGNQGGASRCFSGCHLSRFDVRKSRWIPTNGMNSSIIGLFWLDSSSIVVYHNLIADLDRWNIDFYYTYQSWMNNVDDVTATIWQIRYWKQWRSQKQLMIICHGKEFRCNSRVGFSRSKICFPSFKWCRFVILIVGVCLITDMDA